MDLSFPGRRPTLTTPFLQDLNAVRQAADASVAEVEFEPGDELAIFRNTSFLDTDSGVNTDFTSGSLFKSDPEYASTAASPDDLATTLGSLNSLSFMPGFDLINVYPTSLAGYPDPHVEAGYAALLAQQQAPVYVEPTPKMGGKKTPNSMAVMPATVTAAATATATATTGLRPLAQDLATRLAVDEDKRKRNTLASARFRVKKKQREQALEKNAADMSQKVSTLETKVHQLETENKWLKNLIMEKNDGKKDLSRLLKELTCKLSDEPMDDVMSDI